MFRSTAAQQQQQHRNLRRRSSSAALLEHDCNSNVSDSTVSEDNTARHHQQLVLMMQNSHHPNNSSSNTLEEESQPETLETSSSSDVEDFRSLMIQQHYYRSNQHKTIHEDDEPPCKEVVRDSDQWENIQTDVDVEKYMTSRSMTATQERWNAVTVIPNPLFCFYYIWSASWLVAVSSSSSSNDDEDDAIEPFLTSNLDEIPGWMGIWNSLLGDQDGCLAGYPQWHSMPALPPLPVVAVALGIALHAPFSFLYHWKYAYQHGAKHWSRRMDQAMIHICSACLSYAVTGNWNFFLLNAVYNLDCSYRLFSPHERPLRNQARIFVSFLAYTLPLLLNRGGDGHHHNNMHVFVQLWAVFLLSGWFFAAYPVGGWSHTVFHLVIALAPPLLLQTAAGLEASAPQLRLAAYCRSSLQQQ